MYRDRLSKGASAFLILILFAFGTGCADGSATRTPTSNKGVSSLDQAAVFDPVRLEGISREYFQNLDLKRYEEAYAFLSDSFKQHNPYSAWSEGDANTLNHAISSVACQGASCTVTLVATEIVQQEIRKEEYVLRYNFIKGGSGQPLINSGLLESSHLVEDVGQGFSPTPRSNEIKENSAQDVPTQDGSNTTGVQYRYSPPFVAPSYAGYSDDEEDSNEEQKIEDGDHQVEACHNGSCYSLDAEVEDGVVTRINFPNGGYRDIDAELDGSGEGSGSDNNGENWDVTIDE